MNRDELLAVLTALDELNSWLRTGGDRFHLTPQRALRRHIYWIKKHAIEHAHLHFTPVYKRVFVYADCRSCNGTGIYDHWSGNEYTCRHCSGDGRLQLRFVETNFEGIRWHIPQNDWYSASLEKVTGFDCFYPKDDCHFPAENWSVHQEGKTISHARALYLCKVVFNFFRKDAVFIVGFFDNDPRPLPLNYNLDAWLEGVFTQTIRQ